MGSAAGEAVVRPHGAAAGLGDAVVVSFGQIETLAQRGWRVQSRGEAARVQRVKDGLVVPGEQLAQAWGLTRQALAPAAARGEVFAVKVGNRLYYPQAFLTMDRDAVAAICRALGDLGASEKRMFWVRDHGALEGKSVAAALEAGTGLAEVERLAAAWARERGVSRVAAAA